MRLHRKWDDKADLVRIDWEPPGSGCAGVNDGAAGLVGIEEPTPLRMTRQGLEEGFRLLPWGVLARKAGGQDVPVRGPVREGEELEAGRQLDRAPACGEALLHAARP